MINFKDLLKKTKFRVVIIIFSVTLVLGILIGIYQSVGGSSENNPTQLPELGSRIRSIPGDSNKLPPHYLNAVVQSNQDSAQRALATGQSSIPTALLSGEGAGNGSASFSANASPGACDTQKCPNTQNVITQMVSTGDLSPVVGSNLTDLVKQDIPPAECAEQLSLLVQDGRLASDQAKKILATYQQEYAAKTAMASPATANDVIDQLLASGSIQKPIADQLKQLSSGDLSPEGYAAALNALVNQSKITPDQAAQLLNAYRSQKSPSNVTVPTASPSLSAAPDMSVMMPPHVLTAQMVEKEGMTPAVADSLNALADQKPTLEDYAKNIQQLVTSGKITAGQAKRLIGSYSHAQGIDQTRAADVLAQQMLAAGDISAQTADSLKQLTSDKPDSAAYAEQVKQLMKQGQLTPNQALDLVNAYRKAQGLPSIPSTHSLIDQLASTGSISSAVASQLHQLTDTHPSVDAYQNQLNKWVQSGNLTQPQADQLSASYRAQQALIPAPKTSDLIDQLQQDNKINANVGKQLKALTSQGLPPREYADKLNALVQSGQITADQAKMLLDAYQKEMSPAETKGSIVAQQLSPAENAGVTQQAQPPVDLSDPNTQKAVADLQSAIQNQAQSLLTGWRPVVQTTVVAPASQDADGGAMSGGASSSQMAGAFPYVKAGTIMFAVLNTGVSSDRPGPIMATIVSGKLKGAKMLGSLTQTPDGQRVMLNFNMLMKDNWPKNATISAVAINPDTASTALASHVDNHYLIRWGSLFAGNFLQGYASAINQSGTTTINNNQTTTTAKPSYSPTDKFLVGLGQVGQQISTVSGQWFNMKPTVTVDAGVGLGILFMQDVMPDGIPEAMQQDSDASSN
ncbi:MAG: hypothetical protein A2X77_01315 [Gammaproteobacteria bacterium GWE2_42_36]|nr:MAG: hypothetical protein A2X77_01315 [Gammaproteobacteria bacterium GWE2_42_36]HCU05463.1 hypothetical protein [Coxiellaceae bacterium]